MDVTTFWGIVDVARGDNDDAQATAVAITESLSKLDADEIVSFAQHLSDCIADAYRWDLWAVAYIINGGCSDDGFEYFRAWLVAQGRERYQIALSNPEAAGEWAKAFEAECEAFLGAPWDAYQTKTGEQLPYDQIESKQHAEPAGKEWDEDTVEDLYPMLATKFA